MDVKQLSTAQKFEIVETGYEYSIVLIDGEPICSNRNGIWSWWIVVLWKQWKGDKIWNLEI